MADLSRSAKKFGGWPCRDHGLEIVRHQHPLGLHVTENCEREAGASLAAPACSAHVIAGKRLAVLISNCHRKLRHQYRRSPLWAMVSDITGHGSTYSVEICLQCGYDPNQNCGLENLKASAPNAGAEPRRDCEL